MAKSLPCLGFANTSRKRRCPFGCVLPVPALVALCGGSSSFDDVGDDQVYGLAVLEQRGGVFIRAI